MLKSLAKSETFRNGKNHILQKAQKISLFTATWRNCKKIFTTCRTLFSAIMRNVEIMCITTVIKQNLTRLIIYKECEPRLHGLYLKKIHPKNVILVYIAKFLCHSWSTNVKGKLFSVPTTSDQRFFRQIFKLDCFNSLMGIPIMFIQCKIERSFHICVTVQTEVTVSLIFPEANRTTRVSDRNNLWVGDASKNYWN
uniref:Uncharacterized protein n=1 Tax=Vespula pensylvanica TaxID=30213 RepID=A0A834P3Q3_VESPE|nr:hypothetical protein H0235_008322 [Vespula pensylvanica]